MEINQIKDKKIKAIIINNITYIPCVKKLDDGRLSFQINHSLNV